jgi:hypothetical protein
MLIFLKLNQVNLWRTSRYLAWHGIFFFGRVFTRCCKKVAASNLVSSIMTIRGQEVIRKGRKRKEEKEKAPSVSCHISQHLSHLLLHPLFACDLQCKIWWNPCNFGIAFWSGEDHMLPPAKWPEKSDCQGHVVTTETAEVIESYCNVLLNAVLLKLGCRKQHTDM